MSEKDKHHHTHSDDRRKTEDADARSQALFSPHPISLEEARRLRGRVAELLAGAIDANARMPGGGSTIVLGNLTAVLRIFNGDNP